MIEVKDGLWTTEDGQGFETLDQAIIHKRELIRSAAVTAGCTTEAEIKLFRKRFWVVRQHDKMEKKREKEKKK